MENILAIVGIVLAALRVVESVLVVLKKEKELTLVQGIIKTIAEFFKVS